MPGEPPGSPAPLHWSASRTGGSAAGFEDAAQQILGIALVVGGLAFLVKAYLHSTGDDSPFLLTRRDKAIAVLLGLSGGFIVGLTSVGSGTFFGLVMLIAFPLTAVKIVGTDIFHAAALLWVAGVGHMVAGNVDLGATAWLLVGSIPGVLLGSQVTVKLPDRAMRVALALVLFLSGVKLLEPPGDNVIVLSVAALGLVLGLVAFLRREPRPAFARR